MTMSKFKKILCPTDFSEASFEALAKAVELAEPGGAEVCVVHVEPAADVLTPLAGMAPHAETEAERRAEAVKNLSEILGERVPSHVRTRPILKQGQAAAQVLRTAQEESVDLIVLTTHGATGWQPGVLGVVAEEVLRTARCPVLTISGPASGQINGVQGGAGDTANHAFDGLRPERETVSGKALYLDGD